MYTLEIGNETIGTYNTFDDAVTAAKMDSEDCPLTVEEWYTISGNGHIWYGEGDDWDVVA